MEDECITFEIQMFSEALGADAARKGLLREHCPFEPGSPHWHHWVYGNEIEQGRLVQEWREEHELGYTTLWMSTVELTDYTKGLLEAEGERWEAADGAMRKELGWPLRNESA